MYAEVIYETGAKSVVSVDSLDALKASLIEHQDRAKSGRPGGPDGHAGERVKRVLLYKEHPGANDVKDAGNILATSVLEVVSALTNNDGVVNVWELNSELRQLLSPLTSKDTTGPHDSMYLAKEYDELDVEWLDFNPRNTNPDGE